MARSRTKSRAKSPVSARRARAQALTAAIDAVRAGVPGDLITLAARIEQYVERGEEKPKS